jgi:predicted nucleic acid-binding protein
VRPVLVDSNVIIDVTRGDPEWSAWSSGALEAASDDAILVINPIIYAEVSLGYASIEELDLALPGDIFRREDLPWASAFLAGRCFVEYRRRGGARRSPLPDFFVGAHAAVAGYRLLTREPTLYRSYFPSLELIAPG